MDGWFQKTNYKPVKSYLLFDWQDWYKKKQ